AIVDTLPDDPELVAALREVGLWEQLAAREGLETLLGDDGFGLSAGQRARLALARALLSPAPLVLLDEPTANMAVDAVPVLHGLRSGLARARRVVVVTHAPALAAQADQVWRLEAPTLPPSRHRAPTPAPSATSSPAPSSPVSAHHGAALLCHSDRPDDRCGTRAVHKDRQDASVPAEGSGSVVRARLAGSP